MFKRIFSAVMAIASLLVASPVVSNANSETRLPGYVDTVYKPKFDGFKYFGAGNGASRKRKSNRLQLSRNTKNKHRRNKR